MKGNVLELFFFCSLLNCTGAAEAKKDEPLPSWSDSAPKKDIMSFVKRVTIRGSSDFVPAPKRIAVFDNDGTLWVENPLPLEAVFVLDELKSLTQSEPELKADPMVRAALAGEWGKLLAGRLHDGLFHVWGLAHAGMTTEEFSGRVEAWFVSAKHPKYGVTYDNMVYQPMLELLDYLRDNEFKVFIVSGGGADFLRVFAERTYGIPPEQVVGSHTRARYEVRNDGPVLVKTNEDIFINDKEIKPAAIHQFIGRRPIACFGNSDSDKEMLEYTTINNPLPSLGLIVRHTDAEREYAYEADPKSTDKLVEVLAEAPKRGWTVIDMKRDWRVIFPFEE